MDLEDLEYVLGTIKLLGSKGTTGTQASFLELFDGDQENYRQDRSDDRREDGILRHAIRYPDRPIPERLIPVC